MAFFPESIMPNRLKDESQDIKGNKYVVSAADVNKHDEEIRAIERVIGIRRPRFPVSGFSGYVDSGTGSFTEGCSDVDKIDGKCPDGSVSSCQYRIQDIFAALQEISDRIDGLRDDYMLMDSGVVAVKDPSLPAADGKIDFPSNWPMTTLSSPIADSSVDEEEELDILSEVELDDVSDLPAEGGFITIINNAETILFKSSQRNIRLVGFTSLASGDNPIYDQQDVELDESVAKKQRIFGLGTNVEILEYEELDVANKKLINVSRKQLGTSSTRHASGDLVFKGRASIFVSPINYALSNKRIDQVDCVLRSDGSIGLRVRNRDLGAVDPDDDDDTVIAYAHYHAVLLRELEPIAPFEPGDFGECPEIT